MEKKRLLMLFVVLLLAVSLAACEQPVPGSNRATPTAAAPAEGATPGAGDVMGQLELLATQTAMAAQGIILETPQAQITPAVPADSTPGVADTPPDAPVDVQPTAAIETPAPTAVTVPTATPGIPASYTLQRGEHAYCIARRFNVDPGELLRLNGLGANTTVYSGTVLNIPQTGNPFPGSRSLRSHPTTHTVSAGDTIYSIACAFGDVDPSSIAIANGLSAPYTLTAGQRLQIP